MDNSPSPEDAVVIAEVLRRLADAVGSIPLRADMALNQPDFYRAINDAYHQAFKEAKGDGDA